MNKEAKKIYDKNYNKLHKEEKKIYTKNYRKLNKARIEKKRKNTSIKNIALWLSAYSLSYWKTKLTNKKYKNLTPEFMEELTIKQGGCCYYTGIPLKPFTGFSKGTKLPLPQLLQQVSIDKLDPKKGYVKGNVVLASLFVNNMKGQCSLNQFKSLISLISKRHNIGKDFQDESFNRIRNKIKKTYMKVVLKDKKRIQRIIGKKAMELQKNY